LGVKNAQPFALSPTFAKRSGLIAATIKKAAERYER
jgi:hypothetical protein